MTDDVMDHVVLPVQMHHCWIWTGGVGGQYGRWNRQQAHRAAYEDFGGVIPEGHQLHHECRIKLCVNPMHLRPMDPQSHQHEHHAKDFCPVHGPEHVDDYVVTSQGGKRCRICHRERAATYRAQDPEGARAAEKVRRDADRERTRAVHKAWRDENPDRVREKARAWREANPDRVAEYNRRRREGRSGV